MKIINVLMVTLLLILSSCKDKAEKTPETTAELTEQPDHTTMSDSLSIQPIEHATMVLEYGDIVMYVDPVGGIGAFQNKPKPNYVLVTDIHGDHMDPATLQEMDLSTTILIVPKAVAEKLPELTTKKLIVMNNGETESFDNLKVEAIPMYNLRKEALDFHVKGRGNGYLLTLGEERIYISGDTEDIPEMRHLKDIDVAFICMNLPYTMTVESAASAVLDFKPKKVYPYHYRGSEGMSDVSQFKKIVNEANPDIQVVQLKWYK